MKALVTGATGFIGSTLVRRLAADGWRVRALVRPTSDRARLANVPVEWVVGDVNDASTLDAAMRGVDALFHCAAVVDVIAPRPEHILGTNIQGTRNVLGAARQANVPRIVYLSSVAALGYDQDGTVEETAKHSGVHRSLYDESKHLSEDVAREFARHGMDLVLVNPSIVIGPGDPKTGAVFQRFLRRKIPALLREGGSAGYVHVEDLVDGILLAYRKGRSGERYIFNQANWSHAELMQNLERVSGVPAPRRRIGLRTALVAAGVAEAGAKILRRAPGVSVQAVRLSARRIAYSSAKARRELGWAPRDFERRFEDTVHWWMDREAHRGGH